MAISRTFLSWDKPILHSAADWLIGTMAEVSSDAPLVDLSACLVVVPGGLASRRLQEILVQRVEKDGRSLIPPQVITVGLLPEHLYDAQFPFATELTQQFAWGETLRNIAPTELAPLIPQPPEKNDVASWRDFGDAVRKVYRELISNALDFTEVAHKAQSLEGFTEQARWDVLAKLQSAYLKRLDALKIWDKQSARLYAVKHKECRCEEHIVLLGTVDLNRVTRQMLDQVAEKQGKITALIGAPKDWGNHFDEHGCLVAEAWMDEAMDLDWQSIAIVDGPTQQADQAAGTIAQVAHQYSAKEIIIGLPEESLLGEIRRIFQQHGIRCRYGPGEPVTGSLPFRLLECIVELSQTHKYQALASAVRHPDLFDFLKFSQPGIEQLDAWFNARLPDEINGKVSDEQLENAIAKLSELTAPFATANLPLSQWAEHVRQLLLSIYGERMVDLDSNDNLRMARPLSAVNEALAAWSEIPESLSLPCGSADMMRVLRNQLAALMVPAEHDAEAIEVLGWLELPLMDAPVCVVTSFCDGLIPSSNSADLFLPNTLRKLLGLEDDSLRYARDAYQVQVIQHTRQVAAWIVPKRNAEGDPLAPSRLLFTGSSADLPQRVQKFFGSAQPPQNSAKSLSQEERDHRQRITIPLPGGQEMPSWDRFSATRINQYLKCPYRFYLKYVVGLQGDDDWATELDGGAFGNLAHDTLQAFGTGEVKDSTDEKQIFEFLSDTLSKVATSRYGKNPLATIKLQIEQLRLRLRAFAQGQALHCQQGWIIKITEVEIERPYPKIEVDKDEIVMVVLFERIDHNLETGEWAVWDYKTGDSVSDPEKDHQTGPRNAKEWTGVQLPFYRHLVKSVGVRGSVLLGYITLPKLGEEVRFRVAKWTEEDLDEADATIIDAIRNIRAGNFFPPADMRYVDEFSRICQDTVLGKWEVAP